MRQIEKLFYLPWNNGFKVEVEAKENDMTSVIYQKPLAVENSTVLLPPSKSISHRAVICAALSGSDNPRNLGVNADIIATTIAMKALLSSLGNVTIDCNESGSTLRFLIPIAAALGKTATFIGKGRLPSRPIGLYEDLLSSHGVTIETKGGLPLGISGKLNAGIYTLAGNISSQFITGLMFALPLCDGDSEIVLTSTLESAGYVDLTLDVMSDFGIEVETTKCGWKIKGNQSYKPCLYTVEGDWSQAVFFMNIAAFSGRKLLLSGLNRNSLQGDKACIDIYRKFGLEIEFTDNGLLSVFNTNANAPFFGLKAQEIDARQIPDLMPAISMCAALAKGTTHIYGAERLRIKESDRLLAMHNAINVLGGNSRIEKDEMYINGVKSLKNGSVDGVNDHRIVMSVASAAFAGSDKVKVSYAEAIRKSYPDFFNDYRSIGGVADVINMG